MFLFLEEKKPKQPQHVVGPLAVVKKLLFQHCRKWQDLWLLMEKDTNPSLMLQRALVTSWLHFGQELDTRNVPSDAQGT